MYDIENKNEVISGEILDFKNGYYKIDIEGYTEKAIKGFSCLISPKIGDIVSLQRHNKMLYITHILYRVSQDMQIDASGKITLRINSIELFSSSLYSHIENVKNFFNTMELSGLALNLKAAIFKTFSKTNENTHIEVTNKFDRSFTYINEIEEVQTKLSRHLVEENKIVKANNIFATAKNQVKIDGENILLA